MNKNNAKDYLPLVQALADGKVIQWLNHAGIWEDSDELSTVWVPAHYRIKPEPIVVYVVYTASGTIYNIFKLESSAITFANQIRGSYKKFVEVVE